SYVSPGYFKTMEIAVLAGRDFNDFDTTTSHRVAIVNETFARRFLSNRNPIGALIRTVTEPNYPETLYEEIGMDKHTKYADLRGGRPPVSDVPAGQHPSPGWWAGVVVRSSAPLGEVINQVRRKISDLNPDITVEFNVFETRIRESLIRERLMAWLAGFFGIL